jgi:aminoglycoside 3-N-acetyltransferase
MDCEMANDNIVRKILSLSPHIEIFVRRFYWANIEKLSGISKFIKKKEIQINAGEIKNLNYYIVENHLRKNGVKRGSLLVVHSAFTSLRSRVESANELLEFLLNIIGPDGTLAMPAMPFFKNARPINDYLSNKIDENVYFYDVQRSRIKTGALPSALHKRPGSIRSKHPINTMVAFGLLAEKLMNGNLSGESPLACGITSSWYRCVEEDAIIVSIGTDLSHSLTMIHVAEDTKDNNWPIKNWYSEKHFHIKDKDFEEVRILRERAPKWGALHFAERTLCKDLLAAGLLKSDVVDGVLIEILSAKALIDFLNKRNNKGYPYYWLKK